MDGVVQVWDATPLKGTEAASLRRTLPYPTEVWALGVSSDGRFIAVGGQQPATGPSHRRAPLLVWPSPGFSEPFRFPGQTTVIFSLDFSPTGRFVALCGDEPEPESVYLKVRDLELGREAFPVEPFGDDHVLFSVAFSPDTLWLVGGAVPEKPMERGTAQTPPSGTADGHSYGSVDPRRGRRQR